MRKLLFATLLFSAFLTAREPTAEDLANVEARKELVEEGKRSMEIRLEEEKESIDWREIERFVKEVREKEREGGSAKRIEDPLEKPVKKAGEKEERKEQAEKREAVEFRDEGYCRVSRTLEVALTSLPQEVYCIFRKVGMLKVYGEFVPLLEEYRLTFVPVEGEDVRGRLWGFKSPIVLNASKTSNNVATQVNKNAIKHALKIATKAGTRAFIQAQRDLAYQELVRRETAGVGGTAVNIRIDPSYPYKMGAYSFGAAFAEALIERLFEGEDGFPVTFRVASGTRFYVRATLVEGGADAEWLRLERKGAEKKKKKKDDITDWLRGLEEKEGKEESE